MTDLQKELDRYYNFLLKTKNIHLADNHRVSAGFQKIIDNFNKKKNESKTITTI